MNVHFTKILDLSDLEPGCHFEQFSFDWNGEPLVLISEGKPAFASVKMDGEARAAWYNSRPKGRHVRY